MFEEYENGPWCMTSRELISLRVTGGFHSLSSRSSWEVCGGVRARVLAACSALRHCSGALRFTVTQNSAAPHQPLCHSSQGAPSCTSPISARHSPKLRNLPPSATHSSAHPLPAHPASVHFTYLTNMADVDMADAPVAKTKAPKAGASAEGDKKRFEVKKVRNQTQSQPRGKANMS
jgi:hypothetical protein